MSAVIPKDLTGLVRDPTKMDAWVKGERGSVGNNLCNEITLPLLPLDSDRTPVDSFCELGLQQSLADFTSLANHIHMMQVYAKFRTLTDHPKIINSFYSGATPDQLMPALDVEALALRLISEHEGELTQLDNLLGVLTSTYMQESIQLFSSLAVNNSLKEQRLMQATTSNTPFETTPALPLGFNLPAGTAVGGFKPGDMASIGTVTSEDVSKLGSLLEAVDGNAKTIRSLKSLDQVRKPKRKKSKPKSAHIPNMNNRSVKRALGATILMKLGQVQRDTSDAYKRAMLKELPAADLLEMATGEKLPDYQANLINNMQAKADPTAPVVERMVAGGIPLIGTEVASGLVVYDELAYHKVPSVDTELDKCINNDELFPENASQEEREVIVEKATEHFGRGLTNVLVHYDDGIELTNEQRQALLEEREGIVDVEPYVKTDEVGRESYHYGQTSFKYVGGPTRRDIEFTNSAVKIFRHYEDLTANACAKLGITLEELERIITNDIFWNELTFNLRALALKKVNALIGWQLGNPTEYIDHFIESFIVDFVKRDKE